MSRREDRWDQWYNDREVALGRMHKTYACKYCNKSIAYWAARLFRFLGFESRNTNDIAICTRVHPHIKLQFVESGGNEMPLLVGDPLRTSTT